MPGLWNRPLHRDSRGSLPRPPLHPRGVNPRQPPIDVTSLVNCIVTEKKCKVYSFIEIFKKNNCKIDLYGLVSRVFFYFYNIKSTKKSGEIHFVQLKRCYRISGIFVLNFRVDVNFVYNTKCIIRLLYQFPEQFLKNRVHIYIK